jgi:hypothetical protein
VNAAGQAKRLLRFLAQQDRQHEGLALRNSNRVIGTLPATRPREALLPASPQDIRVCAVLRCLILAQVDPVLGRGCDCSHVLLNSWCVCLWVTESHPGTQAVTELCDYVTRTG